MRDRNDSQVRQKDRLRWRHGRNHEKLEEEKWRGGQGGSRRTKTGHRPARGGNDKEEYTRGEEETASYLHADDCIYEE